MWAATVSRQPLCAFPAKLAVSTNPKRFAFSSSNLKPYNSNFPFRLRKLLVSPTKNQLPESGTRYQDEENDKLQEKGGEGLDLGWLPSFPHILVASISDFIFGYHIGVMNGPIVSIARELGFEGDPLIEGLVVSIFIAGAFIGSLSTGSLVDKLGCRRTFQIDMIPLILGTIICAKAHSLNEILGGRFLVGLGIGVNTVLLPIYISEVAPTKYRGALGALGQMGTCLGIIASLFLGIPSENDPHWWRTILYVAIIPGFIIALGMQFAVDSPRWLCKAGRVDDAKKVVRELWGATEVDTAIQDFQSVSKDDGSDLDTRWSEILQKPNSRGCVKGVLAVTITGGFIYAFAFIGGALFVLQQFSGINGVLYFSSLTFQDVGVRSGALASLFVGLTNFAGSLSALYLIDRQGRRKLLTGSYLGMGIGEFLLCQCPLSLLLILSKDFTLDSSVHAISMFLVVCAISFQLDEQLSNNLSILGTIAYIFSFAIGSGPVTAVIIPELSSTRTRGKIMAVSLATHWICNFVVGLFYLELVKEFGVAPIYASFGAVSLLAAVFANSFIVETKGRSLEEIERSLYSKT